MMKKSWKSAVAFTAIGTLIGSTLATAPAMADSKGFKVFWGQVFQNGQFFEKSPAIAYSGSSYFGLWAINQLLQKDGIQVTWNGESLALTGVPVQQTSTLTVSGTSSTSGTPTVTNSVYIDGVTYVPLSTVQAMLQQMGSGVQLNEGDGQAGGDGQSSGDGQSGGNSGFGGSQSVSLQGPIHVLGHAIEKLSEYQKEGSGDHGHGFGAVNGTFTSAMAQISAAMTQLNGISAALGTSSTSGSGSSTSTSGTTGTTSGSSSTSTTGSTSTSTDASGSNSTSGAMPAMDPAAVAAQLQQISTSLQTDLTNLNQVALSAMGQMFGGNQSTSSSSSSSSTSGTSTSSTADLSSIIADLTTQEQALMQLQSAMGSPSGDSGATPTSGDN